MLTVLMGILVFILQSLNKTNADDANLLHALISGNKSDLVSNEQEPAYHSVPAVGPILGGEVDSLLPSINVLDVVPCNDIS
jgi:hypothetical protein